MTTIVYNGTSTAYQLGARIGGGGEADIHEISGRLDLAAKIFIHKKAGYENKLKVMKASPPEDPNLAQNHSLIAWPRDLLYDNRGNFTGYLMPRVRDAVPLFEVYNPKARKSRWPDFDERYLYRTAQNLASAFAAIHAKGYVIGDVNESNALVKSSAMVTLIDTDSFQVRNTVTSSPTYFLCEVGKEDYTPPELQGKQFRNEIRTQQHDRFGLAVLIFQLLMKGCHPFDGIWQGMGDPPPRGKKIKEGWFPFAVSRLKPRPGADINSLHPSVVALMYRCFIEGHRDPDGRPTAMEWRQALRLAADELESRGGPPGHMTPVSVSVRGAPNRPASAAAPPRAAPAAAVSTSTAGSPASPTIKPTLKPTARPIVQPRRTGCLSRMLSALLVAVLLVLIGAGLIYVASIAPFVPSPYREQAASLILTAEPFVRDPQRLSPIIATLQPMIRGTITAFSSRLLAATPVSSTPRSVTEQRDSSSAEQSASIDSSDSSAAATDIPLVTTPRSTHKPADALLEEETPTPTSRSP